MGDIIELSVGGVNYTTSRPTLTSIKDSLLTDIFSSDSEDRLPRDKSGRYFLDRDGELFRYILDYIRNRRLLLPDNFNEQDRLKNEAEYFRLGELIKLLGRKNPFGTLAPLSTPPTSQRAVNLSTSANSVLLRPALAEAIIDEIGTITVGYRGTFAFGRDGLADVKFRKLNRLLICGKVKLCRSVFGDTLNESRDPDRGEADRYSARFFLKHNYLEQAFDMLLVAGFKLQASCGTGTNSMPFEGQFNASNPIAKSGAGESEEGRWYHYNEFIWVKSD